MTTEPFSVCLGRQRVHMLRPMFAFLCYIYNKFHRELFTELPNRRLSHGIPFIRRIWLIKKGVEKKIETEKRAAAD